LSYAAPGRYKFQAKTGLLSDAASKTALGVPEDDGNPRGYRGCDYRLRPLRRKVRRVREDITDERRDRADRRLPGDAVSRQVHLGEQGNGNRRADNPANQGEKRMLETERGKNVATRHHEKAG
jgi:hypothetical protein